MGIYLYFGQIVLPTSRNLFYPHSLLPPPFALIHFYKNPPQKIKNIPQKKILVRDVEKITVIPIFLRPLPVPGRQPAVKFQVPISNGLGDMMF